MSAVLVVEKCTGLTTSNNNDKMPPETNAVNVDNLLKSLNDVGKFNIIQYIIVSLNWLSLGTSILAVVFIGIIPDFQCRPYDNSSILPNEIQTLMENDVNSNGTWLEYGQCSVSVMSGGNVSKVEQLNVPCTNGYIYSRPTEYSFISEWDLVCERAPLGALTQTLLTVGMAIGAFSIPNLADRFGRKPVMCICQLGVWGTAVGLAFAPSLNVFVVLRVFIGIFQQGLAVPCNNIGLEMFVTERRAHVAMLLGINWSISCMVLTLISYLFEGYGWRIQSLVMSCTACVALIDIWFMEESLRWLFAKGHLDRAKKIIKKAAKTNGLDFNNIWYTHVDTSRELDTLVNRNDKSEVLPLPPPSSLVSSIDDEKTTFIDSNIVDGEKQPVTVDNIAIKDSTNTLMLFIDPTLRFIILIQFYCWFICSLTYYGIYLTTSSPGGNYYLDFFIAAFCEFLALLTICKFFVWFGRKKATVIYFSIGAFSLISSTIIKILVDKNSKYAILGTVTPMIGMFGIAGAFTALWSYLPELIPTFYRNAAVGLSSTAARIGSGLSPFSAFLIQIIPWGPAVVFSGGCLIANVLVLMLPETRDRQMPQSIADVKAWLKKPVKIKHDSNNADSDDDDDDDREWLNSK